MGFHDTKSSFRFCCTVLATSMALLLVVSHTASAQVSDALSTTDSTNSPVQGSIFASKSAVYFSGGANYVPLAPDGTYVFQVTDPSGSVLLSLDNITCRQVIVSGGATIGVPSTPSGNCLDGYHNLGTSGSYIPQPIQLCNPNSAKCDTDFANTPDPRGAYKVWLTPVAKYTLSPFASTCSSPYSHVTFGFCDSDSQTEFFQIRKPGQAEVTDCKFLDPNGNGFFDPGEQLLPGWPLRATGVDGDTGTGVLKFTGKDGCATFIVSESMFNTTSPATVKLSEGASSLFTQTAPQNGTCIQGPQFLNGYPHIDPNTGTNLLGPVEALTGTFSPTDTCTVSGAALDWPVPSSGGEITLTVSPGDTATAPFFANQKNSATPTLLLSQTAFGGNNFKWSVAKRASRTELDTATGSATFAYTVNVTRDGGTGWQLQGSIAVTGLAGQPAIDGVTITDIIDRQGKCNVNGTGTNTTGPFTISGFTTLVVQYTCKFPANPVSGNNTVTVSWDPIYGGGGPVSITEPYDFTAADTAVVVTDSLAGSLGTVTINNDGSASCATAATGFHGVAGSLSCPGRCGSTASFTYSLKFTGDPVGKCTEHNNTASFETNTGGMGNSGPATAVFHCVGVLPNRD